MDTRASISDGDALLELRRNLIDCFARAGRALDSIETSARRSESWLRDDRARTVSKELRRDENRFSEAKIALMEAKTQIGDQRARAHETEERDFKRARAQLEQTEALMQRIKSWLVTMPRELSEPLTVVRRARHSVDDVGPKAIAHLDNMIEAIEKYQSTRLPNSAGQS
jgi:hypothetical protein